MATRSGARDLDAEPNAVLVVVDANFADVLHEAAGGSFAPKALAAAAPVVGLAGLDGQA